MPNGSYMGLAPALYKDIAAKTAAYKIVPEDVAVLFTNRGATGSVTLTLPDTATLPVGWWCEFFVVADQTLAVAAPTADTMVTFNNAAADSIAFSTSNEKIGGGGRAVWDGTGWLISLNLGMDSQTPVITDA